MTSNPFPKVPPRYILLRRCKEYRPTCKKSSRHREHLWLGWAHWPTTSYSSIHLSLRQVETENKKYAEIRLDWAPTSQGVPSTSSLLPHILFLLTTTFTSPQFVIHLPEARSWAWRRPRLVSGSNAFCTDRSSPADPVSAACCRLASRRTPGHRPPSGRYRPDCLPTSCVDLEFIDATEINEEWQVS